MKLRLRHAGAGCGLLLGLAAIAAGAAAWRLSEGPIPLDRARPAVERLLAGQVQHGSAHVRHAELAYFPTSHAIGLRLDDVALRDHAGRVVLTARQAEAGTSLGGLFILKPALAHITARDFFAAVSVSPQGRYALGYDAAGAGGGGADLGQVLRDLTGRVRPDRPLSWLRTAAFTNGRVALRQVGAPLSWTGEVRRVAFHKGAEGVSGQSDLMVHTAGATATLLAQAEGSVGLGRARISARLDGLAPAAVFPSVGATRQLAVWDAPVAGRAELSYGAKTGIGAADLDLVSAPGALHLGKAAVALRAARLKAHYEPRAGVVVLDQVDIDSDANAFALSGQARLVPERGRTPAELQFALQSPGGHIELAQARSPAAFQDLHVSGRIIPARHRVEFDSGRLGVGAARLDWRGAVTGGAPGRSPTVELDGGIHGDLELAELLAVWPQRLSRDAREWVAGHIDQARAGDADYRLRLPSRPNGDQHRLPQDAMHIGFAVRGARVSLGGGLPVVENASGRATVSGDGLQIALDAATAQGLALSRGAVEITHFKGANRQLKTRFRAVGDARRLLEAVDGPGDHMLTRADFQPSRVGGVAEVDADITRPLLDRKAEPPLESYVIAYRGVVRGASLQDAVLGLDLHAPLATFEGTGRGLKVSAPGVLGPYRGAVRYSAQFGEGPAGRSDAEVDGAIDAALVGMGGPAIRPMPVSGRFDIRDGVGHGRVQSAGFTGEIDWTSGLRARSELHGALNSAALRLAGLPVGRNFPATAPARLMLVRNGASWAGTLDADLYSGQINFTPGERSHLRYTAQMTPDKARRLGLGADGVFARPQPLLIDLALGRDDGAGSYALGPFSGQVGWSQGADGRRLYRWRAILGADGLHMLGLPASMKPKALVPVDVSLSGTGGAWDGSAAVAGARLRVAATAPTPDGRRRVNLSGPLPAATLEALGALKPGIVSGAAQVNAVLAWAPQGFAGGQVNADLTRAAFAAPGGLWTKSMGQPFSASALIARAANGAVDARRVHAAGAGAALDGDASWRPDGYLLRASSLRLPGVYDGAAQVAGTGADVSVTVRARLVDARRLLAARNAAGRSSGGPAATGAKAGVMRLDLQAADMRVTDKLTLQQVKAVGAWGPPAQRRLDLSARANAGGAMILSLYPSAGATAIHGRLENVSDAAETFLDVVAFKGGVADISGQLQPGGADVVVDMRNVRLTHAPVLAQLLTLGSFTGMANTMNGQGIAFAHVVAPLKLRGSKLYIGQARATGPALGLTTEGVVDMERRTVALNGAIAPSYTLNAMFGRLPLVGKLLVSRKGEGIFGVTYTARGAWQAPRVAVNPLSLAAPGFLRRMFEPSPRAPGQGSATPAFSKP